MIEGIRREAAWTRPLAVALVLAVAGLATHWWRTRPAPAPTVSFSTFQARLDAGGVNDLVVVPGSEIRGTWKADRTTFRVVYPTAEVTPLLQRAERARCGPSQVAGRRAIDAPARAQRRALRGTA